MGNNYGFTLLREDFISELHTKARLFEHNKTKAKLLSLINDDDNKVFSVNFPTKPGNSKGIPHILEHSVLCGSRKYPVKEPFIELVKGSVNTFINAFTSADHTSYPCASTNEQDFYNMIDVYTDAVFFPKLGSDVFAQEGWHYELNKNQLEYKGVVFNEMKGAYSSADGFVYRKTHQLIMSGTSYAFDSGGDPLNIPDLTYEEFYNFYKKHYHPSNAFIYFYGDDSEEKRLKKMAEYLDEFDTGAIQKSEDEEIIWPEERSIEFTYPAAEEQSGGDRKYFQALSWLFPRVDDIETIFGLSLLNQVLIGSPAAPLRKALIESGLGEDVFGSGIVSDYDHHYFSLGLKGVRKENLKKVDALVLRTITKLMDDGIDENAISSALNTIEFRLRENNSGSTPKGLVFMMRLLPLWFLNDDPFSALKFEAPLASIRGKKNYFKDLLKRFFLNNEEKLSITAVPDSAFVEKINLDEKNRLAERKAAMTAEELLEVKEYSKRLHKLQGIPDAPEDIAKIPRLKTSDLNREIALISSKDIFENRSGDSYFHEITTNGIVYLDVGFNLQVIPQHLLSLIPVFSRCFLQMGTEKEDYTSMIRRIGTYTGGLRLTRLVASVKDSDDAAVYLFIRGKSTKQRFSELAAILGDLFTLIPWDNPQRFSQILQEEKSEYEAGLIPSGHVVTLTRMRSSCSVSGWLKEQFGGVSYLLYLRELEKLVREDWSIVSSRLQELYSLLLNNQHMIVNITADSEDEDFVIAKTDELLDLIPGKDVSLQQWDISVPSEHEAIVLPTQVNYIGGCITFPEKEFLDTGANSVIQKLLSTDYLWNAVRVRGGAYGAWAFIDNIDKCFSFMSYRDPQFEDTFKAYEQAAEYLISMDHDEKELMRVVIGVIGDFDMPLQPDAQGFTAVRRKLCGISDEYRQQYRDEIFAVTGKQLKEFGLMLKDGLENMNKAVLCSPETIKKINAQGSTFKVLQLY